MSWIFKRCAPGVAAPRRSPIATDARVIDRLQDLYRTFPEEDFFKAEDGFGQRALCNVLSAYSLCDEDVGYCQGMCFVAGVMLMHVRRGGRHSCIAAPRAARQLTSLSPVRQLPEECTFYTFTHLMFGHLRDLYRKDMRAIRLCLYQLGRLIERHMPSLWQHLDELGYTMALLASHWFLTAFASVLQLPAVYRILDAVMLDGLPSMFQVAMAILQKMHATLMQHVDLEEAVDCMKHEMPQRVGDGSELMELAQRVPISSGELEAFAKDFAQLESEKQRRQQQHLRWLSEQHIQCVSETVCVPYPLYQVLEERLQQLQEENDLLRQESRRMVENWLHSKDQYRKQCQAHEMDKQALEKQLAKALDELNFMHSKFEELRIRQRLSESRTICVATDPSAALEGIPQKPG